MNAARFIRTVRNLRASQWYYRARYAGEQRLKLRKLSCGDDPRWQNVTSSLIDGFQIPPLFQHAGTAGANGWQALCEGRFIHLNREVDLGTENLNWNLDNVDVNRLWAITLHYHQWAYELAEAECSGHPHALHTLQVYLDDWWQCTSPESDGSSKLAWNAYAIATRLSWWIRTLCLLGPERLAPHPRFYNKMLTRICQQADYLSRHVEWDLRANHVLRDAVGLAWAGRFIAGPQAEGWLRQATAIAVAQVEEQILPDGGQFERSPMYHIHVMEDVLSLAHLLEESDARRRMYEAWDRMAEALAWLRHPDGRIAQLNDAVLHGACDPSDMLRYGDLPDEKLDSQPRSGGRHFPDTGLVVWHGTPWSLFFDVGEVGPSVQPGHAHADTLSVECSYQGSRLFIDPGTYGYEASSRREYDRSTASHNTVSVDGENSSEVWHVFRVGRRARPFDVQINITKHELFCSAAHDGYSHLSGHPIHRRTIDVRDDGKLRIKDEIEGRGEHRIEGGLLLAPGWTATIQEDGWILTKEGAQSLRVNLLGSNPVELEIEACPVHPEFHVEVTTQRLVWRSAGTLPVKVQVIVEAAALSREQPQRNLVPRERVLS